MGLYARVRRACMVEGMSTREAARVFGLHRDTVRKMLQYSVPPGYRRESPPRRPKLDPYRGVIDRILEDDRSLPKKQRHTAKRIYERLRAEHGFTGKYTIVKDYVRERRRRTREMYVPLSHPPGDWVPLETNRAASLPSLSAAASSRRFTVGSCLLPSSPTSASAMARRISGVGSVRVSLWKSTTCIKAPPGDCVTGTAAIQATLVVERYGVA